MRYEHKGNFKHIPTDRWTFQTTCCYKYKGYCKECPENIVCSRFETNNPYSVKPVKYAMILTYSQIGKPKGGIYDEL
ncbi:MAG: hypothetical protein II453_10095 [Alphaproteobacteria bacterium]|nr:hypothetical protein [Alphaproteobacteria bacterium]MBQ3946329.1 hypothetical protein [Alphaproteobacteria bacterium]